MATKKIYLPKLRKDWDVKNIWELGADSKYHEIPFHITGDDTVQYIGHGFISALALSALAPMSAENVVQEIKNNPAEYLKPIKQYLQSAQQLIAKDVSIMKVAEIDKNIRLWKFWIAIPFATFTVKQKPNVMWESPNKPPTPSMVPKKPKTTPDEASPGDMAYTSADGNKVVILTLSNIQLYTAALKKIFATLDEKIRSYDIELDTPFNPLFYAAKMEQLTSHLKTEIGLSSDVAETAKHPKIILTYNKDFSKLISINYQKETKTKITNKFFEDRTINALTYRLGALYNEYAAKWSIQGGVASVFLSQDEIKSFLNKFIVPKPFITTSIVTEKIVEKFILGDVRLLDDTVYNAYKISRKEIPGRLKVELSQQIDQQYEQIGDFLGLKFEKGGFEEIEDIDDLYEQLLDYIDVDDLIALSAKCLLKLIPVDTWLDHICEGVLEDFDEHQEKIIQALENMEESYAKVLAQELTEVYFEFIDEGVKYTEQIAVNSVEELAELAAETYFADTWSQDYKFLNVFNKNYKQLAEMKNLVGGVGENSIDAKKKRNQIKLKELEKLINEQNKRITVFEGTPPLKEKEMLDSYIKEKELFIKRNTGLETLESKAQDKIKLLQFLNDILIELMLLSPSFSDSQKAALVKKLQQVDQIFEGFGDIDPTDISLMEKGALDSISSKKLIDLQLENPLPANLDLDPYAALFTFGSDYLTTKEKNKQKNIFRLNLKSIQKLYNVLEDFSTSAADLTAYNGFGDKTKDAFLQELFADKTKRYYLCLAIYSAVPAAAVLMYQVMTDLKGTGQYLGKQASQIAKGFTRRFELMSRTDYPIWDILKVLKESIIQIGKNLARDLIIYGIMATLKIVREACSDNEKINAPYDPLGAIDLSGFITKSLRGSQQVDSLEKSGAYARFGSMGLSLTDYSKILSTLSSAFTINEMCNLLEGGASAQVYAKALAALQTIEATKDTSFAKFYLNEVGIRQFFKVISKDINPAFCAQAITNFEKEKSALLSLCFGTDDSILAAELSKYLSPEQLKQSLADRAALPPKLLKSLVKSLGNILGGPIEQDLFCSDTNEGIELYDESQQFSANIIGNSLFGALESTFETDISQIKDIYKDAQKAYKDPDLFGKNPNNKIIQMMNPNNPDKKSLKDTFDKKRANQGFVASAILNQVQNNMNTIKFIRDKNKNITFNGDVEFSSFQKDPTTGEKISTTKEISFAYEAGVTDRPNINLVLGVTTPDAVGNLDEESGQNVEVIPEHTEIIAETMTNKFGDKLPDSALNELILLTDAPTTIKERLNTLSHQNDFYMILLNSIFKDLYASSFRNGLFERDIFNELTLNKTIKLENCFLGFVNKTLLNKQMQRLAKKLACMDPESPTKTPVNVATIKIALDSLIRILTVKEVMKSLFVYNTFVSELLYDNKDSFYDIFLSAEIEKAFKAQGEIELNSDVIQSFITDIMRVIYSDDTITDTKALEIIKASQLDFVKALLFEAIPASVAYPALVGGTSFQIAQESLTSEVGEYISLKDLSSVDKVQTIQNDYFASYVDSNLNDSVTQVEVENTYVLENTKSGLLFKRFRAKDHEVKYFNYKSLEIEETADLKKLLQDNNSGIILEDMVEFDFNTNFRAKMSPVQLESFNTFLTNLLNKAILQGTAKDTTKYDRMRKYLKGFLYESKLICLFPQMKKIVDSLSEKEGEWTKYVDTNLFVKMFEYNFAPNFDTSIIFNDSELLKDLDMSLCGKFYRNDLENFINNFNYPYQDDSLVDGKETSEKPKNYFETVKDILDNFAPSKNSKTTETSYSQLLFQSDIAKSLLSPFLEPIWGKSLNLGFFEWLYKKPLRDIIKVNTVISLNGYIDISEGSDFDDFQTGWFITPQTKEKLEEKIGDVLFADGGSRYFSFPIQEVNKAILSDITWFDFLIKIDKAQIVKEDFYEDFLGEDLYKGGAYKLNDVLFNKGKKDIFAYFAALNTITNFDVSKDGAVNVYAYESTDWVNIRGHVVSKEQIVAHVDQVGGAAPAFAKIFADSLFYNNNPYAYLTDGSYHSLIEDESWIFMEDGSQKSEEVKNNILSAKPSVKETSVRGYSLSGDVYNKAQSKIVVGSYIVKNPITGEDVEIEKYIKVNHRYHISLPSPNGLNNNVNKIKDKVDKLLKKWYYPFNSVGATGTGTKSVLYKYKKGTSGAKTEVVPIQYKDFGPGLPGAAMSKVEYRLNVPINIHQLNAPVKYGWEKNNMVSLGFETKQQYDIARNDFLVLVWRHAMQEEYDIQQGGDPLQYVRETSQGWWDIDWGWNFWNIKYNNTKGESHPQGEGLEFWKIPEVVDISSEALTPTTAPQKEEKYPGATFLPGVIYMAYDEQRRPKGNAFAPGILYPGQFVPNGTGAWNKGFILGGRYNVTKTIKPLELEGTLQFNVYNVFEKMLLGEGQLGGLRALGFNNLIQGFFVKEQTTIIAVLHRLYAEKNYPMLNNTFDDSISKATEILLAAMASANGDYRHTSPANNPDESPFGEVQLASFGKLIMKAFITAAANTVDPTWTTPWFFPGPFTPFGVVAKALHTKKEEKGQAIPSYIPARRLKPCEDELEKQLELLNEITKNEKPKE